MSITNIILDIHGQAEKLRLALKNFGWQRNGTTWLHLEQGREIVFLGDFIDRGPENTAGCTHFVYLHPDYLGQGMTLALTDQARRSNPVFTPTLLHGFATKELEDWVASLGGAVEVGMRQGQSVFVREIARAM